MRHSIRFRLIFVLTVLIIFTIFVCWFMNRSFLSTYYQYNKINTLGNTFEVMNKDFSEITDVEDSLDSISLTLEKLSSDKNIGVYVVDFMRLRYGMGWANLGEFLYPQNLNQEEERKVLEQIGEVYDTQYNRLQRKEILEKKNDYFILKIYDERIESQYLELVGTINVASKQYTVYMRTNFESIQESVEISNQFLAYVGIIAICLGILVMFFISGSFTRPIKALSDIAKKMSDLNFETKYKEKRQDEIGDLGNSINILSEKLESTISELKTANNELKTDIERKMQVDEMRKEFLSNVSHELKTPIALIQGYAEGLKENIHEDEESRDFYCEVIVDEANKMNKMVKKLLSLNQIEFGNNQLQFERFDIIALIQSILSSTEILFQQKQVKLNFEEYTPIYVWADEYMVEEVLTNYISNALNHVSRENIIEVKLIQKENAVRILVFNTGEQIPEEDIEKVWIKFYKVDKARTREYGGSGIGLSIVKAIMTALNRECGVMNHSNGVEFWFELDKSNE